MDASLFVATRGTYRCKCNKHTQPVAAPPESGFYLKWIPRCLAAGNSISWLPSVCDCLTFVDSHPEKPHHSQAVNERIKR